MKSVFVLALLAPGLLRAQECAAPRVLFDFDVSGSMAWDVCGNFITVDHTLECPGSDVWCSDCPVEGCDNGVADDSRLFKVKAATTEVVNQFPNVEFSLARFHQEPENFSCVAGGWEGATASCFGAPLGEGFNSGDILVEFAPDSHGDVLEWLDGEDNFPGTANPWSECHLCRDCGDGCDKELRPQGATPIGGSLFSVRQYIEEARAADPLAEARPYVVVVLTDGENNCPDPDTGSLEPSPAQARALCDIGVPVFVIGFSSPQLADRLNAMARRGCDASCNDPDGDGIVNCQETAYLVDTTEDLSAAMADIVQRSAEESCNGADDDCDGETDEEPMRGSGQTCGTDEGECQAGLTCCADGTSECCGEVGPTEEVCDCLDNDCDGATDEDDVCGGGTCESCVACEPHTQGYWHRQCLGCGLIESGGQGPGPHPDYTCEQFAALLEIADADLGPLGQDTCQALDADPPSDACERALKQTAAVLLNRASGLVSSECALTGDADGLLPDALSAELLDGIAAGRCKEAASLADAFNTGALCPGRTGSGGGGDAGTTPDGGVYVEDGGADADAHPWWDGAPSGSDSRMVGGMNCGCGVGQTRSGRHGWWTLGLGILVLCVRRSRRRGRRLGGVAG